MAQQRTATTTRRASDAAESTIVRDRLDARPVLITGGAGFIGTNVASRLAGDGSRVLLYDNLTRRGAEENLAWLQRAYPGRVEIERADVRDTVTLGRAVRRSKAVFHFAAQVAVTTSLADPLEDFDVNAGGTLKLLEVIRALPEPVPLVYTSTNKVYGNLPELDLVANGNRWVPRDRAIRARGIGRQVGLDLYSPYGCSKGAADQYVLDYSRVFGLRTLVFRMSCIYGPHQHGTEDQGWVAHFLIRYLNGDPLTIYGDGRQVRDILFVEDLVDAFLLGWRRIDELSGRAFNIGGGPANTVSLVELMALLRELVGRAPEVSFAEWRPGDQRYYVSDVSEFQRSTSWRPRVGVRDGLAALCDWLLGRAEPEPVVSRAS
jgi:CDP-paratose 2-epimerase